MSHYDIHNINTTKVLQHTRHHTHLVLVSQLNGVPIVIDLSISVGVLEEHPAHVISELKACEVLDHDLHPEMVGPGPHHCNGLRVATRIHEKHILIVLGLPACTYICTYVYVCVQRYTVKPTYQLNCDHLYVCSYMGQWPERWVSFKNRHT